MVNLVKQRNLAINSLGVRLILKGKEDFFDCQGFSGFSASDFPHMTIGSAADFGYYLEPCFNFLLEKAKLSCFGILRLAVSGRHIFLNLSKPNIKVIENYMS